MRGVYRIGELAIGWLVIAVGTAEGSAGVVGAFSCGLDRLRPLEKDLDRADLIGAGHR